MPHSQPHNGSKSGIRNDIASYCSLQFFRPLPCTLHRFGYCPAACIGAWHFLLLVSVRHPPLPAWPPCSCFLLLPRMSDLCGTVQCHTLSTVLCCTLGKCSTALYHQQHLVSAPVAAFANHAVVSSRRAAKARLVSAVLCRMEQVPM